ncbi:helicase [Tanacetum coccineum]
MSRRKQYAIFKLYGNKIFWKISNVVPTPESPDTPYPRLWICLDAYTAVDEQRLKWTRNNQDTLRVDLYHNLCDAVTRGDTSAAGLGKRIVLPNTFMRSPRYMMHNYQDAMALCRAYDNPDLFITFTSNPKWPEIAKMLAYFPGQKAHDRPEVGIPVFKLKLTELLDDLTKKHVFGQSEAVVYVIEFQKRGLPHAHILLWLEEHSKCKTPSEIDYIISVELPSPTDDLVGYKVMVPEPRIMPPRRFKKKSVKRIVEKRMAKAIEEYEKTRTDSNNAGGSGSANTEGTVAPL